MTGKHRVAASLALLGAAAAFTTGGALLAARRPSNEALALALEAGWFASFLAVLAAALAGFSRRGAAARLGLGPGRLPARLLALAVLGMLGLSLALDHAIERLALDEEGTLAVLEAALEGARGVPLAAALAGLGIAPAIGEELLFRGLIQRGLVRRLGALLAVGVAAATFAFLHLDPVQGAAALALGLYLGAIAQLADSIRASIVCHGANNLVAVGSAAFWPDAPPAPPALAGLGLLAGAAALIAARRHVAERPRAEATSGLMRGAVEGERQPVPEPEEGAHQPAPDHERDH